MVLDGKTFLIAGGAGLVGAAAAGAILARGGNVTIADVKDSSESAELLNRYPSTTLYYQGDVTQTEQTDAAIAQTISRFGAIDGAVQSAYPRSPGWGTHFEELSREFLALDLQNQLGGTILFAQRVVAALKSKGGSLVLVSSIQGLSAPKFSHYEGTSMMSPIEYSAIKAGVNAVARYLAKYLQGQNIRVNVVSPGGILDKQPESFLKRYRKECSNKGMLDADDISGAICFLLSDEAQYINGQNIVVDDGWSL